MRLLILCSKKYWMEKMSRVRFHAFDAICRHPEIQAFKDGPGFDGWVNCQESVKKYNPDVVFWYKPMEMELYDKVTVPKVIAYNEMYDVIGTKKEIVSSKSNIVICHLANDIKLFQDLHQSHRFVPMGHCVETSIFKDYQQPNEYDILLTGLVDKNIYPLRYRFQEMIKRGAFGKLKTKILKHPGYRINTVDDQVVEYAKELNKAKIVLTCSSKYKYALAKYMEIPACGVLCIGDIPNDREDFFRELIVPIDTSWADSKIIEVINNWLKNETERVEKIKMSLELIRTNHTQEHYAQRFLEVIS